MKPWRAYSTLQWFILFGLGLGAFFSVILVTVVGLRANQRTPIYDYDGFGKTNYSEPRFTDQEILSVVYSDYKYPPGFYLDGQEVGYCVTAVVKDGGLRRTCVCADNRNYARQLSEISNAESSVQRPLISERETEKYFEFRRRERSGVFLDRVDKCSYIDRSQALGSSDGSYLGQYNVRPITNKNFKDLMEYLWFDQNAQLAGRKLLDGVLAEHDGSMIYTVYETSVTYGDHGGMGGCDSITLLKVAYTVNINSGRISSSSENVRTIKGRCSSNIMQPLGS